MEIDKPMHLAYVTQEFPPDSGWGGIGTYTYQVAHGMAEKGHRVEVFALSDHRDESVHQGELTVHWLTTSGGAEFGHVVLEKFVRQHGMHPFDLVECPELGGHGLPLAEAFPDLPLVVRLHTPGVLVTRLQNTYTPLGRRIRFVLGSIRRGRIDLGLWSRHDKNRNEDPDYQLTQKAWHITSPSNALKQWAEEFWKIRQGRIRVIPNPYQIPAALLALDPGGPGHRITFLGRLNVLKGLVALGGALSRVLNKHPEWRIRFIGKNEMSHLPGLGMKEYLLTVLEGCQNQIEWIDWIEPSELPLHFQETDVLVIPSLFESFSYVCAEAMGAARAIVGSRSGGIRELLGKGGLLVNPKSETQLARALEKYMTSEDLRREKGREARQRLMNQFEINTVLEEMEEMYHITRNKP